MHLGVPPNIDIADKGCREAKKIENHCMRDFGWSISDVTLRKICDKVILKRDKDKREREREGSRIMKLCVTSLRKYFQMLPVCSL